jgi:hypothetical protein
MPVVTPKTLPEWQEYVSTFTGAELLSKAKAANSLTFLRAMESEGMAPQTPCKFSACSPRNYGQTGRCSRLATTVRSWTLGRCWSRPPCPKRTPAPARA